MTLTTTLDIVELPEVAEAKQLLSEYLETIKKPGFWVNFDFSDTLKCENANAFAFAVQENRSSDCSASDYCMAFVVDIDTKKIAMYGRELVYYSDTRYSREERGGFPSVKYYKIHSCIKSENGFFAVQAKLADGRIGFLNPEYHLSAHLY